jgi:hypothetical protein
MRGWDREVVHGRAYQHDLSLLQLRDQLPAPGVVGVRVEVGQRAGGQVAIDDSVVRMYSFPFLAEGGGDVSGS